MGKFDYRNLENAVLSQQVTERNFKQRLEDTKKSKRIRAQISCTISPDEKDILNQLTLEFSNRVGRPLCMSTIVSALIRLGKKRKEEIELL